MLITKVLAQTFTGEVISNASENSTQVVSNVVGITSETQSFFSNLDWTMPSWDLFIILLFLVASLIYGLSMGRGRPIVVIISIYMALVIIDYVPFMENLITGKAVEDFFVFKIASFLVVFLLLFYLLAKSVLFNTRASKSLIRSWWQATLFSFLQVGLLISIVLSFLPEKTTEIFSGFTNTMFTTETARFVWIVLPIILIALIRKPKRKRRTEIDEYLD